MPDEENLITIDKVEEPEFRTPPISSVPPPGSQETPTLEPKNRVKLLFLLSLIPFSIMSALFSMIGLFGGVGFFFVLFAAIFGAVCFVLAIIYIFLYYLFSNKFNRLNVALQKPINIILCFLSIVALLVGLVFFLGYLSDRKANKIINATVTDCENKAYPFIDQDIYPTQEYFDTPCAIDWYNSAKEKRGVATKLRTFNASSEGIDFTFDYYDNSSVDSLDLSLGQDSNGVPKEIIFRVVAKSMATLDKDDFTVGTIAGYPAVYNYKFGTANHGAAITIGESAIDVACTYGNESAFPEEGKAFLKECERVISTIKITKIPTPVTTPVSTNSSTPVVPKSNSTSKSTTPTATPTATTKGAYPYDPYDVLKPTEYEYTTGFKPGWLYGDVISFTDTELVFYEDRSKQNITVRLTPSTLITDGEKKSFLGIGDYLNIEYEGFQPSNALRINVQKF